MNYTYSFFLNKEKEKQTSKVRFRVIWGKNRVDIGLGYTVDADKWVQETQRCKRNTTHSKKMITASTINKKIQSYEDWADDIFREFERINHTLSKEDFKREFDKRNGKDVDEDKGYGILSYIDYYISYLRREHVQVNGKRGVSERTIKKFGTLKYQLNCFLDSRSVSMLDVDRQFIKSFDYYLKQNNYAESTISTQIKALKLVLRFGISEGLEIYNDFNYIRTTRSVGDIVTLSFNEIDAITDAYIGSEYLDNARDWLIIGCYCGQRVGDLLNLTKGNIVEYDGVKCIELTQGKTGKKVILPILPELNDVLAKRNGDFPRAISDVKFNLYIKEVCKLAGIDEPMEGKKIAINSSGDKRKVSGMFKKYELITSHICRRSFATNYYSKIPTTLIMQVTGHTKESTFLTYIGKTAKDFIPEMAKEFNRISLERKKKKQ